MRWDLDLYYNQKKGYGKGFKDRTEKKLLDSVWYINAVKREGLDEKPCTWGVVSNKESRKPILGSLQKIIIIM